MPTKTEPTPDVVFPNGMGWVRDGEDLFIVVDGVRIAKRRNPQAFASEWVVLEPGWVVLDDGERVQYSAPRVH